MPLPIAVGAIGAEVGTGRLTTWFGERLHIAVIVLNGFNSKCLDCGALWCLLYLPCRPPTTLLIYMELTFKVVLKFQIDFCS